MKLVLDKYAYLDSPIHRWEHSYKLIGLLSLIFAFAFVQNLWLLPILIAITVILFALSKLPISFLLTRLRYPSWFIGALVFFLPFVSGKTTIFKWGVLAIRQEGCEDALLISVRFFCILTISLILFGTAPFLSSIKTMRSFGMPQVIVDMTLLAYRYLEELGEMLTTMQRAMKLRGFQNRGLNRRCLQIFAQLTGSILIRSYDRSLRIYQAMILRGYGYQSNVSARKIKLVGKSSNKNGYLATVGSVLMALGLISMEIFLT